MRDSHFTLPVGTINIKAKKQQFRRTPKQLIKRAYNALASWWYELVKTEEGVFDDYVTKTREEELKEIK